MKSKQGAPELSLVIPYYNDAGCAKPFIDELKKELAGVDYELILVDDCSKDTTPQELDELKEKRIKIVHNEVNKDYGGAIIAGLEKAEGKILGFSCGDGEVSPKDIAEIYRKMGDSDIFKAVRVGRKDGINREFISFIFNKWAKMRFKLDIGDINGYPVFFKREVYNKVSNVRTDWIFNTDLLRKMINAGYSIHDSPVIHQERNGGKSKMTPKRITKMVLRFIGYK